MISKKVDTRDIEELNKNFYSYNDLINYYKSLNKEIFLKYNIYTEKHHIVPKSENGKNSSTNLIELDYLHHIMAHYLHAIELQEIDKQASYKNFLAVSFMCFSLDKASLKNKNEDLSFIENLDWVLMSKQSWVSLQSELYKKQKLTWVTNGTINYRIPSVDADNIISINPTFYKGRSFTTPKGKIWISNGTEKKYLPKEEAITFLNENSDWFKGMGSIKKKTFNNPTSTMLPTTLGKKWIHFIYEDNTIARKNVYPNEVEDYISKGWKLGSGNSNTNLNKISVYKENIMKNIPKGLLDDFLKEGWSLGRTDSYRESCSIARSKFWKNKKS